VNDFHHRLIVDIDNNWKYMHEHVVGWTQPPGEVEDDYYTDECSCLGRAMSAAAITETLRDTFTSDKHE